jgi:LysR family carnitine catabolism transcriptional activator
LISLSNIRGFLAVAKLGSFRLASEEISRTQPALSTQISNLEDTLGVKLFARTTRKTILTREGKKFLNSAKRIVLELDSIVLELKDEAALNQGKVSIGCVPTLTAHLLPPIIAEFSKNFPAIEVCICDDVAAGLYDRVSSDELDFAICPEPGRRKDILFDELFTDNFVVVFPNGHRFCGRNEVKLSEVLKEDNLTLVKGMNVREVLDKEIIKSGADFVPKYELLNHYSLGGMVEGGLGVTMLPRNAYPMLSGSKLKYALVTQPRIGRTIGFLRSSWRPDSSAATAFQNIMRPILKTTLRAEF